MTTPPLALDPAYQVTRKTRLGHVLADGLAHPWTVRVTRAARHYTHYILTCPGGWASLHRDHISWAVAADRATAITRTLGAAILAATPADLLTALRSPIAPRHLRLASIDLLLGVDDPQVHPERTMVALDDDLVADLREHREQTARDAARADLRQRLDAADHAAQSQGLFRREDQVQEAFETLSQALEVHWDARHHAPTASWPEVVAAHLDRLFEVQPLLNAGNWPGAPETVGAPS